VLYEQTHYCDGEAGFPYSIFQVAFHIPHHADVSDIPDKSLLSGLQEQFITPSVLVIKKRKARTTDFTCENTCHSFLG
jgi:hypothetical protein